MPRDELRKGSAEFLVLALLEQEARHGYELSKLIAARSRGALSFNVASLYPLLYRLERRGWVQGKWVEKAGQRRRRYYTLTGPGRKVLRAQRQTFADFVEAVRRVVGPEYA
jgi:transcriptional regulator